MQLFLMNVTWINNNKFYAFKIVLRVFTHF